MTGRPIERAKQLLDAGSLQITLYHDPVCRERRLAGCQDHGTATEQCRYLAAAFKYLPHFQEMPTAITSNTHPAILTPELPAMPSVNATKLKPTPIKHSAQPAVRGDAA
jgi:hypothetical protein